MDRWTVIRQAAAATLRDYERRTGRPAFTEEHGSHGVLEELAEECFRLTVVSDPDLPKNIRGKLNLDRETIAVRPDLSAPRRNLTIGHDLGHRALAHPPRHIEETEDVIDEEPYVGGLAVHDGVYRAYSDRDRWELEANVFGAELLAPVERVRTAVLAASHWTVDGLARYFGLSRTAMHNQLATALLPEPPPVSPDLPAASPPTLDLFQEKAAIVASPALVIAGPGAGKTRVLVSRFVDLVQHGAAPRRILSLTFGNKAAEEMRERLVAALPEHGYAIEVATFHSLGFQLLQEYGGHIGLKLPLQLLTPADAFVFLRQRLAELPLGRLADLYYPSRHLKQVLDVISRAKDELVGPAEFAQQVARWQRDLAARPEPADEAAAEALEQEREEAATCADIAAVYATCQEWFHQLGYLDYGDLITEAVRLFAIPEVAADIRGRYDHLLVDEFQDINYASGRLLRALDGGRGVIWAVGDPKQSIYRFRGASPVNLRQFGADYPGATIQHLARNYRSVEDVVQCGQAVRIPTSAPEEETTEEHHAAVMQVPALSAHRGRPSQEAAVEVIVAPELSGELAALVARVEEFGRSMPLSHISVLCRTRGQAQKIAEALEAQGLPTTWGGALEERPVFKDLMGVLLLAADDLRGLVRLARLPEHQLSGEDLRLLLSAGRSRGRSVQAALHAACAGEVEGLSPEGREQAARLKSLAGTLTHLPTPWRVLGYYLFEYACWPRALFGDPSPEAQRCLATLGQVVNLAREFAQRSTLAGGGTTTAFLEFLQASLEAGELGQAGETITSGDAVNVLTIHKSKGLEWPVVLIPHLAEGRFPPRSNRKKLPIPPGLLRGAAAEEEIEEACLFYVAMTRARDRLVLTRAEKYPNGRAAPLTLLSKLIDEMAASGYLRESKAPSVPPSTQEAVLPGEEGWSLPADVPFRALKRYQDCPRRFMYETVYGLTDEDVGYIQFHEAVYATMDWAAQQARSGSPPASHAVAQEFHARWEEVGPSDHPLAAAYRRTGEAIVQAFAGRLTPGAEVHLRREVRVRAGGREVTVKVDEIEEGRVTILRWHRFGSPSKRHASEDLPALLAAAHVQEKGETPYEVRLYYPLHGRDEVVPITSRVMGTRTKKMEELVDAVEGGLFPPKPDELRCSSCPFHFICPLDGPE